MESADDETTIVSWLSIAARCGEEGWWCAGREGR